MSIASQCSECCTCPPATVEWDSRSASKTKVGFAEFDGYESTPPKIYFRADFSGGVLRVGLDQDDPANPLYGCTGAGGYGGYLPANGPLAGATEYDQTGALVVDTSRVAGTVFTGSCTGTAVDVYHHIGSGDVGIGGGSTHFCCGSSLWTWDISSWSYNDCISNNSSVAVSATEARFYDDSETYATAVLSLEYTTADLKTNTVAALSAYDDDWNDTAGSFANLSTDELSYSIRESRYRLRFKIPKVNTGKNYRVSWVERFIPEAGVAVSSVEVYARGVYRPTVTLSASPLGTNAAATAVMASDGTIASLSILNPGAGYIPLITFSGGGGTGAAAIAIINSSGAVTGVTITSGGSGYTSAPTVAFTNVTAPRVRATGTATVSGGVVTGINIGTAGDFRPTVTVQAATGGGTSSTGWIATLTTTGQVASIASGSAGNYRPTLVFSAPGGSPAGTTATATCTVDPQGGIATVTIGTAGTKYLTQPNLTITPKVSGSTAADLLIHLGTETAKCAVWDGTTLGGKWVKREVVDAGHSLTSIEVVHGGNYLPTVTIGGPGTGATATVTGFSADGKVTAISVGAGGTGYTSAPSVTITGRNGGSGATATATVSGGAVTGITIVDQGNYLPTLSITGGGGAGATATVALNGSGAISEITLTAAGSGFKINPTLTLSYYGTGTILLAAHFGTETEYADNAQPAGTTPLGYVDGVVRTYPLIGSTGTAPWKYYELAVPATDGTTLVANLRTVCDSTVCP